MRACLCGSQTPEQPPSLVSALSSDRVRVIARSNKGGWRLREGHRAAGAGNDAKPAAGLKCLLTFLRVCALSSAWRHPGCSSAFVDHARSPDPHSPTALFDSNIYIFWSTFMFFFISVAELLNAVQDNPSGRNVLSSAR